MKFLSSLALLLFTLLFFVAPAGLESCAPMLPSAVFTPVIGPIGNANDYLKGNLGVVMPAFWMRDLFVAYRYFSAVPLTPGEVAALTPPPPAALSPTPPYQPDAIDLWTRARKAGGAPDEPKVDPYRQVRKQGYFDNFLNCLDDSFRAATTTLMDRKSSWGPNSANLAEWIAGQDLVFRNCQGPRAIPVAMTSGDPLLVADRQYQIAAAAFYDGDWDLARKSFDVVAANPSSPWRANVPYLKARVSIREATVGENHDAYARAERELTSLATSNAMALLGYVAFQAHPFEQLTKLSADLEQPQPGPVTKQSLTDFLFLESKLKFNRKYQPSVDLSDWAQTYQRNNATHAIEKWRSSSTLPWLVASLAAARQSDAVVPDLIAAATKIDSASPAYPTVNYYAARLETGAGRFDAARVRVNTLLKLPLPGDSHNLFLAARLRVAEGWPEFLKYAPRVPVGESYDGDAAPRMTNKTQPMLDRDATSIFNAGLPMGRWVDAATSPSLPLDIRKDLLPAAWTRAIVLNKDAEARKLAAAVQKQRPDLASAMQNFLAAPKEAAHFTAIYWMLKYPGFSPVVLSGFGRLEKIARLDVLRDNWWVLNPIQPLPDAPFLTAAELEQGRKQWQSILSQAPNGADYLASETIRFAKDHPNDPRAPEALALAVRATHLISTGGPNTGPISKQAFDLLHANYPNSRFARETKYWYK